MNKIEHISYTDLESFYASIPEEGSLGILALGATGVRLWRKKRLELENRREMKKGPDYE